MGCVLQGAENWHALITSLFEASMGRFVDVPDSIHRGSDACNYSCRILILKMDLRVGDSKLRCGDGKLREAPAMLCSPRVHEEFRDKVGDLCGHLARILRRVEGVDVVD